MGAVTRKITDVVGLTQHGAQEKARKDAQFAASRANKQAEANLEFQKEQYEDWKSVYGDIQDNLGEYYENLGGERIATLGLQEQQIAYQQTRDQIQQRMAQRGLSDSNFEDYLLTQNDLSNNAARANIRANADTAAAQQQMQFLSLGLGQGQQAVANIGNAYGQQAGLFNQQAAMANQTQQNYLNNNAAMTRSIFREGMGILGTAMGGG